jgi:ABC-type antimicrobial peptide transport system permease subunit
MKFRRRQPSGAEGLTLRSKLTVRRLIGEAMAGVSARPMRSALTIVGTVMGITSLVATLGVSRTAGNQIVARFDAVAATEVVIEPASAGSTARASTIPWDAEARMLRLNGVIGAGTISAVNTRGARVRSVAVANSATSEYDIPMYAGSPGLFAAVKTKLQTGRVFDSGHNTRAERVAVLGPGAAAQLQITRVSQQPAIFVGNRLFVVIGILEDVARQPDLLDAVIVPNETARRDYGLRVPGRVAIDTSQGAASLVARQAPKVLDPTDPSRLRASAAASPKRVRDEVASDTNSLFLILGAVSLLVGAVGIANVTLVSVMERIGEIGLRRALGAGRRHIAAQFLTESTVLGLIGGTIGASLGVLLTVAISAAKEWTPVLDQRLVVAAPVLGAIVGLLAGLYPALRAASLQPVDALRAGT